MATTGFWPVKGKLSEVIDYAANPDKTIDSHYLDADLAAVLRYLLCALFDFCLGGVLFSYHLPKLLKGIDRLDVTSEEELQVSKQHS